jgi:hypothetical protein
MFDILLQHRSFSVITSPFVLWQNFAESILKCSSNPPSKKALLKPLARLPQLTVKLTVKPLKSSKKVEYIPKHKKLPS